MTHTKPTDSEQLETVISFLLGETMLDGMWFGDQDSSKPLYWWRIRLRAALQERDQQRLSVALEALPKQMFSDEDPDNPYPGDFAIAYSNGRNTNIIACRQALTAALGPDNSNVEEKE